MLDELFKYLKKPDLYVQSTSKFWDDEHISKVMLEAHLHPKWEAASRCHDFIDKSVEWISEIAPSSTNKNLLDLGCGPGLYAERLYKKGYKITGIDFSNRSIHYAKEKARVRNHDIDYIYKNYMDIQYKNVFDLVILIYCDFVVLSDTSRAVLLKKIYNALKPEGKFIFDIFTQKEFENKKESNSWYLSEESGFWKSDKHICLESHLIYAGNVRLDQYTIIDKDGKVEVIRNWFKVYTKETIIEEVKKVGFKKIDIYSDVTGKPYSDESKTICIVLEK
ncbi:class I SAM-dependent methyltransferase [Marinisporobacter balticus]|uniref:Ubiquinone/menaquinone biosynthesis C-methylase UbiE n=1 Tax=Marinisporobacter balticus TaxID=2018667 RepID=A0A4R2KYF6_9FIRM|nr:class I SAM-dependent methyltransferase [Marinisporobacter balticus]TCO77927.1 ubiquinone/menaquinone biosynthesis C-methylase UbiE [Marinisporobacter balticus]